MTVSKKHQQENVDRLKRAIKVAEAEGRRSEPAGSDGVSKPPVTYVELLVKLKETLVREQAKLDGP